MPKKPTAPDAPRKSADQGLTKPLHPRNKHAGRYDFAQLIAASPQLAAYVAANAYGDQSIDFADPLAVRALNRALLKDSYGVTGWDLPPQYLCPPIPGRADALHYLADLLARSNGGQIPYGAAIRVLDIGVGANCVYPLIGHSEYGWSFVGSDIDRAALASAQAVIDANHQQAIELRFQPTRLSVFKGVLHADELFDLVMCNPPFHASIDDAQAGSARKWQNLGQGAPGDQAPRLNFGGQSDELCCAGGEQGFICRMIGESAQITHSCLWFTTLVSKATTLPAVYRALKSAGVHDSRTIAMAQGQKKSRIVAWTWLDERQQQAWRNARRGESARTPLAT
ncbi:MAG: rRNA methyltransferase [Proteobacteria bacterium]|nr:rRNA methyltransferase [Pseudomonadota bacterium]